MKRIFLVLLLLVGAPAFGQFAVPVKTDVESILSAPDDGMRVILRGTIAGKLDKEQYMFTDGSGYIPIDVEDRILWGQVLVKGTRVEIEGKVDKHFFSDAIDIDVERVMVLKGSADAGGGPDNG